VEELLLREIDLMRLVFVHYHPARVNQKNRAGAL
jgi:hypothetical protein